MIWIFIKFREYGSYSGIPTLLRDGVIGDQFIEENVEFVQIARCRSSLSALKGIFDQ